MPEAHVPAVRIIMEEIYGYSDQTPNETVTVNKAVYEKEKACLNTDIEAWVMEARTDKIKLLEEKERLVKRITEIDQLLQGA